LLGAQPTPVWPSVHRALYTDKLSANQYMIPSRYTCILPFRPTQPPTLCGIETEYWPKDNDSAREGNRRSGVALGMRHRSSMVYEAMG